MDTTWRTPLMSEYQRYEFMTIERPLTGEQLEAVEALSSHIEASSTHALIEYHWGDFKHNPIDVLHKFFDGFLYWANWGSPQLAFRFPHGILPDDLIDGYDLDELMEGDLRALYIVWLAGQRMIEGYGEEEEYDEEEHEGEEEDYEISVPPVPPAFGKLTAAQQALAELLRLPQELLVAAAHHSEASVSSAGDDFAAWVRLLSPERQQEYLVRLAHNEPGLSRLLVRELRELNQDKSKARPSTGEHVTYATLLAESKAIKGQLEREKREQERLARQRHLQEIHDHQDNYWHQVDPAVERGTGSGYAEALQLLIELREAADQFKETEEFQERFRAWVRPHLRRPAFVKRLQGRKFTLPEA